MQEKGTGRREGGARRRAVNVLLVGDEEKHLALELRVAHLGVKGLLGLLKAILVRGVVHPDNRI